MRIVAGTAGGRRFDAPSGDNTRPTHERVREAIFSMLGGYFNGGMALDLFAGSGALGLEAISRGIDTCIFSEIDRRTAALVKRNAASLGFAEQAKVLCAPWQSVMGQIAGKVFQVIFLDPPYDAGYMQPVLKAIEENALLAPDGRIVCEIRRGSDFTPPDAFTVLRRRQYGMAEVILLGRSQDI